MSPGRFHKAPQTLLLLSRILYTTLLALSVRAFVMQTTPRLERWTESALLLCSYAPIVMLERRKLLEPISGHLWVRLLLMPVVLVGVIADGRWMNLCVLFCVTDIFWVRIGGAQQPLEGAPAAPPNG
jgi:hypothetical protein